MKNKQHKWLNKIQEEQRNQVMENNSQNNANDNLVRMLEKTQGKQLDNLTTK